MKICFVMEKGKGFNKVDRAEQSTKSDVVFLCKNLLTGLSTLHSQGWMHRDVTLQNILYFEARKDCEEREKAGLCDFGKICFIIEATETALAAWKFLPPEIVKGESRVYNLSIDMWMLALALVSSWYPSCMDAIDRSMSSQITRQGLGSIRERLQRLSKVGLPDLLWRMLLEDPALRPTVQEALADPCFRSAPKDEEDTTGDEKRAKTS